MTNQSVIRSPQSINQSAFRNPHSAMTIVLYCDSHIRGSNLWVVPNGGHGPIFGKHAPLFVEATLATMRIADCGLRSAD
jgi:hypothetical protein